MRIGYIQFEPVLSKPEFNRRHMTKLLRSVDADLVVLPELANAGYNFSTMQEVDAAAESLHSGQTVTCWREIACAKKMTIVGGFAERDGGRYYNSAAIITPRGDICNYRKLHLFGKESQWFSRGNEPPPVIDTGTARVGCLICFDWAFPEAARTLALKGAQIICHPSNIVTRFPPQAMVVRGCENRVFTITANRIGEENGAAGNLHFPGTSQITTPDGKVLSRASETESQCAVVEIDPTEADDKRLAGYTDLFAARIPTQYGALTDEALHQRWQRPVQQP